MSYKLDKIVPENLVLTKLLLSIVILGLSSGVALADIYKITKADGNVVYSDRPDQNQQSKVEVMAIPSSNSTNPNSNRNHGITNNNDRLYTGSNNTNQSNTSRNSNAINYAIKITSPSQERAYRKPVQSVDVAATVTPKLRAGDRVVILVDGKEVASGLSTSIPTTSLNPGEHVLEVKIESTNGANSAAKSMKFYVIQNTIAMQQKRQLVEQMKAFDALPWHQKILAKLKSKK